VNQIRKIPWNCSGPAEIQVHNKNWQEIIQDGTRGFFFKKFCQAHNKTKKKFKETTLALQPDHDRGREQDIECKGPLTIWTKTTQRTPYLYLNC
jgi:hypothetical protein